MARCRNNLRLGQWRGVGDPSERGELQRRQRVGYCGDQAERLRSEASIF